MLLSFFLSRRCVINLCVYTHKCRSTWANDDYGSECCAQPSTEGTFRHVPLSVRSPFCRSRVARTCLNPWCLYLLRPFYTIEQHKLYIIHILVVCDFQPLYIKIYIKHNFLINSWVILHFLEIYNYDYKHSSDSWQWQLIAESLSHYLN